MTMKTRHRRTIFLSLLLKFWKFIPMGRLPFLLIRPTWECCLEVFNRFPGLGFRELNKFCFTLKATYEIIITVPYVSKCVAFSGSNTVRYGHEQTPYLDTFHAVVSNFLTLFRPIFYWSFILQKQPSMRCC